MIIVRMNAENYIVPVLRRNVRKLPCLDNLSIWQDCKQSMSELFVVSIAVARVSKIIGVAQNKRLQMMG